MTSLEMNSTTITCMNSKADRNNREIEPTEASNSIVPSLVKTCKFDSVLYSPPSTNMPK